MDLLLLLVARRGALVSRSEIVERLWSKDVFIDVETGVNTAVRKLRRALGDSRDEPAFIETVARRGYRFVADVLVVDTDAAARFVTLAVLPFANLSGDAEREYIADGLTDDTIASLGQLDPARLRVIGRTSAMACKGSRKSLAAIGEELDAQFVLEGSMRIDGELMRIQCALSRTRDQVQLWSNAYDRPLTRLLEVQRELSVALADHVSVQLSTERLAAVVRRHSHDAAAYDLYLRGRRYWHQLTPESTRMAVECFQRATDIDPRYALAWAGLAEAFAAAPINGDADPKQMWPLARAAAQQAVRFGPDVSEAHRVAGQVLWFFGWDFGDADAAFARAAQLDPNNASAQTMVGHALSQLGCHDEGLAAVDRACTLEPLSPFHFAMAAQVAFQAGDHALAAERARRSIVIDPEFWVGYMMRGQAAQQAGNLPLALDQLAVAARLSGGNSKPVSLRGYVLARVGRVDEAREVLAMLTDVSRTRYVPPYAEALVALGLDEDDRVFASLERAVQARDVHLVFLTVDSKWDRLRDSPRFQALIDGCGFTATRK